ncbi:tetratricopeptide repeat protein [Qipengyuania sp. 1NDH17]|uniref:Tetratricopeptide repeat protein n=1 Tax=Qipengyuania polymorpha TaxID=2867234 RepID=A0ABS7IZY5_9SPHN|nr:tetratricopeptide repeat protein [Qipengyuania polymorpha]MBX7458624.1 tetratricopeptide repeat protein [Qipengyuania polymorpha]
MTLLLASAALAVLQSGAFPGSNTMPDIPDDLRDRPPRIERGVSGPPADLWTCLKQTSSYPQQALDFAQEWRERASTDLEFAQSAHCAGLALVQLGRYGEARQAFELASGEAPQDNLAYAARLAAMAGNAAMAENDVEAALPLLDRAGGMALAAEENELAADLRVDLARVLVRLDRPEDAASALAEAREADALDVEAWLLSATLSRRLERLGEAQAQIERAALLDPRNPQIGLEAGVIAAMAGRAEDARASFRSVLAVAPGSPQAERAQGYLTQLDTAETE